MQVHAERHCRLATLAAPLVWNDGQGRIAIFEDLLTPGLENSQALASAGDVEKFHHDGGARDPSQRHALVKGYGRYPIEVVDVAKIGRNPSAERY